MSVLSSQDPVELLKYGKALRSLKDQNIAIVGSGMSFHNMPGFFEKTTPKGNKEFEDKLQEVAKSSAPNRHDSLKSWRTFSGAVDCHPTNKTEHFSPFLVCAGAGDDLIDAESMKVMSSTVSAYCWD